MFMSACVWIAYCKIRQFLVYDIMETINWTEHQQTMCFYKKGIQNLVNQQDASLKAYSDWLGQTDL
jgi:hypothetical protein